MQEYIASKLVGSGSGVVSIAGGIVDSIVVPDVGVVLLVNRKFPNEGLRPVYNQAKGINPNVAVVFYKDGKTFFRNAAHGEEAGLRGVNFKADLSLKLYTPEQINRMITLRPEEKFARANRRSWIQYFQPPSADLGEGIESFKFLPVTLDYTHILPEQRVGDVQEISKRWNIWDDPQRKHFDCLLQIKDGFLVPRR
jgi:hypothetical protein